MFGIDGTVLALMALVALSIGGLAFGLLYSSIASDSRVDKRLKNVKATTNDRGAKNAARNKVLDANKRRQNVQDSLKDIEDKQKSKGPVKASLKVLIRQAGLKTTPKQFYVYSFFCGLAVMIIGVVLGAPLMVAPGIFFAGFLGLPRWALSFVKKRRLAAFLNEFPNSIDVIVRAIKSGLPLNDGIRLIANEAQEPVRGEFRRIVEQQQLGISVPEAAMKMKETMPCAEANFFGIVIMIQSQAGGNLSEALGNLSRVLRDRKKMKAKIAALSMEAKASAAIIGALPFIVAFLVYLSSPDYIMPLFTTSTGQIILGISGVWMSIGIFVMKNMINFDI
jgi:tight adherence protein B